MKRRPAAEVMRPDYYFYDEKRNITVVSGIIGDPSLVEWGMNIYIGPGADIWATGGLIVGNNVIIGPNVVIHTTNHNWEDATLLPYDGTTFEKRVVIEDNVWIGANSCIVPGVRIGEGAVVGMGSVVTRDVPKCALVGGNPAEVIKYRDIAHYEELKKDDKYYLQEKKRNTINYMKIRKI